MQLTIWQIVGFIMIGLGMIGFFLLGLTYDRVWNSSKKSAPKYSEYKDVNKASVRAEPEKGTPYNKIWDK